MNLSGFFSSDVKSLTAGKFNLGIMFWGRDLPRGSTDELEDQQRHSDRYSTGQQMKAY